LEPTRAWGLHGPGEAGIGLAEKKAKLDGLLRLYFPPDQAAQIIAQRLEELDLRGRDRITIAQLAELNTAVETSLAGSIGAAAAHKAMLEQPVFTPEESAALSEYYAGLLAALKVPPDELRRKIDYHLEREALLSHQAQELEKRIREREQEIAERRRAEEALKESEKKYRRLFESAPEGLAITGLDGRVHDFNQAFMRMFKIPDRETGLKMSARDLYLNPDQDRNTMLERLLEEGHLENYEENLADLAGRPFPASLSLQLIEYEGETRIQSIVRDVTRVKKLEAKLRDYAENLERMVEEKTRELQTANQELNLAIKSLEETRAQLARSAHQAGMAEMAVSVLHNIGNAVTWVNVRADRLAQAEPAREMDALVKIYDLLRSDEFAAGEVNQERRARLLEYLAATLDLLKKRRDNFRADVEFIRGGMDHIMEIISLQQKYVGLGGHETPLDLNEVLRDSAGLLLDSVRKRNIELELDLHELPVLYLDKNRLVQIFTNIIKNAYEAIDLGPSENDKRITIKTSRAETGEEKYVQVEISDTGVGLSPEEKEKVFRFGHSTKERGTGIGLHDAANYIKAHGGGMEISSQGRGRGARLVIRLPLPEEKSP
ncbi:MAG: ATP-binding protein, partial [Thermodesulfobacteriota bacterium]